MTLLYYDNPRLSEFQAQVLSCLPDGEQYRVTLDRTAFYPGGGGEPRDRGSFGGVEVTDIDERTGDLLLPAPLTVGETYSGAVDLPYRLAFMRAHTGEHLMSGILHRITGGDNVGFHMNEQCVTFDWSLPLDAETLTRAEDEANDAVMANLPVDARWYEHPPEEIAFRAKKTFQGRTRLVTVPGVDVCACCGLHVAYTGEVGSVRILDVMRYKGGTRVTIAAGYQALLDARRVGEANRAVGRLVSAKPYETADGVARLLADRDALKAERTQLRKTLVDLKATLLDATPGALLLFEDGMTPDELRHFTLTLTERRENTVAVFSDGRFCIGRASGDVRALTKALTAAFHGRGGGSAVLTQGTVDAAPDALARFLHKHPDFI
ncbi:MAG: alanyl-tRNA editing protein [Eubacteriales bacterium]